MIRRKIRDWVKIHENCKFSAADVLLCTVHTYISCQHDSEGNQCKVEGNNIITECTHICLQANMYTYQYMYIQGIKYRLERCQPFLKLIMDDHW